MTNKPEKLRIPILMYHEIIDDAFCNNGLLQKMQKTYFVKRGNFEAQMNLLAREGYKTITLHNLIDYLKSPDTNILPDKSVIITFDDGYLGNFKYALPILKKHNLTATFFVTVNYIGRKFMMGWNELSSLEDSGMSIQSHTISHSFLKALSAENVRAELTESKKILEGRLSTKIDFISLPHGSYGINYRDIAAKSGYLGGCSSQEGFNYLQSDPYLLKRLYVSGDYNIDSFKKLITGNWKFLAIKKSQKGIKTLLKDIIGEMLYNRIYNLVFKIGS